MKSVGTDDLVAIRSIAPSPIYSGETLNTFPPQPGRGDHSLNGRAPTAIHDRGSSASERSRVCAKRVIVTAEEIVDEAVIRADPTARHPQPHRQRRVPRSLCAHPSYAQGFYDRDNPFYLGGISFRQTLTT